MRRNQLSSRVVVATLWGAVGFVACGGDPTEVKNPEDPRIRRSTEIVLERCAIDGDGVEKLDADNDGKPEVSIAKEGGRELCRVVDLNFDGKPDRTTFLDESGKIRRIESDFDRDGRVDEIALFKDGVLVEKHRATTLGGKLDTWELYESGKLTTTQRDENGDGIVDQWWEYPNPECPLIHSDSDGDGRPDPSATIDYCKATGYVPPPPKSDEVVKSPTFESQSQVVTETSSDDDDAATGGGSSTGGAASTGGGASTGGAAPSGGTSSTGGRG